MQKLDFVAIISSGQATRMPIATENDNLPKCLISYKSYPLLIHQACYWLKYTDELHIVVRGKHLLCTAEVCSMVEKLSGMSLFVHECNEPGNCNAIAALPKYLHGRAGMVQWADILLKEQMPDGFFMKRPYCLTSNSGHRYILSDGKITPCEPTEGNVVGGWYLPNMPEIKSVHGMQTDFADLFAFLYEGHILPLPLDHYDFKDDEALQCQCLMS